LIFVGQLNKKKKTKQDEDWIGLDVATSVEGKREVIFLKKKKR
jgi:hypothetical protein